MTPRLAAAGLGLIFAASACMDHQRRFETVPERQVPQTHAPVGSTPHGYVVLEPRASGTVAHARAHLLCEQTLVTHYRRERVTDVRASDARFVGALALTGAATLAWAVAEAGDGDRLPAAVFAAGAVAAIFGPPAAEGQVRQPAGRGSTQQPLPPGPCRDRPLSEVRVTLRAGGMTWEGTTDAAGRAWLEGADGTRTTIVYVDDVAVPFQIGPR